MITIEQYLDRWLNFTFKNHPVYRKQLREKILKFYRENPDKETRDFYKVWKYLEGHKWESL